MIPEHWLRLAGTFLSEAQGFDYGELFVTPDDWTAEEEAEFCDAVFAWLNEPEQDGKLYDPTKDLMHNWMAVEFLGSILKDFGAEDYDHDDFATQTILVTP